MIFFCFLSQQHNMFFAFVCVCVCFVLTLNNTHNTHTHTPKHTTHTHTHTHKHNTQATKHTYTHTYTHTHTHTQTHSTHAKQFLNALCAVYLSVVSHGRQRRRELWLRWGWVQQLQRCHVMQQAHADSRLESGRVWVRMCLFVIRACNAEKILAVEDDTNSQLVNAHHCIGVVTLNSRDKGRQKSVSLKTHNRECKAKSIGITMYIFLHLLVYFITLSYVYTGLL